MQSSGSVQWNLTTSQQPLWFSATQGVAKITLITSDIIQRRHVFIAWDQTFNFINDVLRQTNCDLKEHEEVLKKKKERGNVPSEWANTLELDIIDATKHEKRIACAIACVVNNCDCSFFVVATIEMAKPFIFRKKKQDTVGNRWENCIDFGMDGAMKCEKKCCICHCVCWQWSWMFIWVVTTTETAKKIDFQFHDNFHDRSGPMMSKEWPEVKNLLHKGCENVFPHIFNVTLLICGGFIFIACVRVCVLQVFLWNVLADHEVRHAKPGKGQRCTWTHHRLFRCVVDSLHSSSHMGVAAKHWLRSPTIVRHGEEGGVNDN